MSTDKNRKVAVAMADPLPGDVPTVMFAIPAGAWDHMKDGKTHTFDLTKAGVPAKIVMFGGPDYASVIDTMNTAAEMMTGNALEGREKAMGNLPNLGIDEPTKQ